MIIAEEFVVHQPMTLKSTLVSILLSEFEHANFETLRICSITLILIISNL